MVSYSLWVIKRPVSEGRPIIQHTGLVGHDSREFLGLIDHLLEFTGGRDSLGAVLFLVDLDHGLFEIGGIAVSEFLDGVDTSGLKQFGELGTDALDTEQVSVVDPGQDEVMTDTGCILEFLAALRALAFLKELRDGFDTGSDQFFSIHRTDALDVDNLISHSVYELRGLNNSHFGVYSDFKYRDFFLETSLFS